ncbi:hypothetical protein ACHWQZ_G016796 [Mnemiopsis leidyi]
MAEKVEAAIDFFDALEPESPVTPKLPAAIAAPEVADETAFFSQESLNSTTRTENSTGTTISSHLMVFSTIFRRMQEKVGPEFTPDNYTCLVTYYASGMVGIPAHSDDEEQIEPGSDIFTISVGAPRTMRFVNKTGKVTEFDVSLAHGSVFSMEASS